MTNAPAEATRERIKFENPPITELVVSLFHMPIPELKAQHIGIYWDSVREKYPLCQQQSIVVHPLDPQPQQGLMQAPDEIFPLPRFWFLSNDHPTLIQVQRNAFMLNWRRLPSAMPSEYPHYENVVAQFWKELTGYQKFLQDTVGGKLDPIQRCELTYVNFITPNEVFANQGQLMNVLPPVASFYDIQTDERKFAGLNATASYRVNPNLVADLSIRFGRRADTMELAVGLELKAHGVPSDLSLNGARDWYDSAHDATYKLFLDATAKQVQETIWKPR
jgi:uncharacterized protein (TIGR04255 family)